jgi:hypothetical protein
MRVDAAVQMQAVQGAEDRGHVAMRTGADDIAGLRKRRADSGGALQDGAEGLELSGGPMGEVGEGAVADLAAETAGLAEEDGGRGVAVGQWRSTCLHRTTHIPFMQGTKCRLHDYILESKNHYLQQNKRVQLFEPGNFGLKTLVRAAVDYNRIKMKRKAPAGTRAKIHSSKK